MRWRGWFGPKVIGTGIGPRSWQGWLVTALMLAVLIGARFWHPQADGLPSWTRPAVMGVVGGAWLVIVYLTYDTDA